MADGYAQNLSDSLKLVLIGSGLYALYKVIGTLGAWVTIPVIGTVNFLVWLAAIILCGVWFGKLASGLDRLERGDRSWSTAAGVAMWYIPIANLFLPFLVVRENYKASGSGDQGAWKENEVPSYLNLWWGLWAVAGLLVIIGFFWSISVSVGAIAGVDAGDQAAVEEAALDAAEGARLPLAIMSSVSTALVLASMPLFLRLTRELAERHDALLSERYV